MIFDSLKKMFAGDTEAIETAIKNGATIIDVRSPGEFSGGSVKGAVNIPHNELEKNKGKIEKLKQPFVLCCASGMRSAAASRQLKNMGYADVIDGKTWVAVNAVVNQG